MSCRAEQKNLVLRSNAKSVHFVQWQIMRGLVSYIGIVADPQLYISDPDPEGQ
jgi:hypothetical protein